MSILPRASTHRRYFMGSGVWLLIAGLAVGVIAIVSSTGAVNRGVGALLACVMLGRGVLQLRRARAA